MFYSLKKLGERSEARPRTRPEPTNSLETMGGLTSRRSGKPSAKALVLKTLAASELDLHYQPIIEVSNGRLVGFEALIRLQGKHRVPITPNEMLPLLEKLDLMNCVGSWVIHHACDTASHWPDGITIAVNIAATQFKDGKLYECVLSALQQSDLPPRRLELEVTESVLLDAGGNALPQLTALQALGCRISMDDFGTGYSSFTQLRLFHFDGLKVDRSFIHDLPESERSLAIVRTIIGLGRSLEIAVTAEGVETRAQMRMLEAEGCHNAQGFLISVPVDAQGCDQLLKRLLEPSGSVNEK